ncbi:hypothetical protein MHM98_18525 [Psychrobium sp. MM17-31]|uniref:hypothetical protein n=1 Tax=Psychrobium sp. MM17-31 TaxID=2917758 RepID=UPI001EF5863C|nr:hypothetical protein [Psychrobium sp. MM17-31]MCG7533327.1 hypothetical protein [Psychrobium sp. MM17-31]
MPTDHESHIRKLQKELDTLQTYEPPTEAWETISRAIQPKKSNKTKWQALAAAISIICLAPYFMDTFKAQRQISTNEQIPVSISSISYKSMPIVEIEIRIIEIEELLTTTEKIEDRVALTKLKTDLINALSVEEQQLERFI